MTGTNARGEFVTVKEAARLLGVHVNTVRRWIGDGRIETLVVGPTRRIRIARAEVARLREPRVRSQPALEVWGG